MTSDTSRSRPAAFVASLLCIASISGCSKPVGSQVAGPLAIDIPELCTRCVEVLRCEAPGRSTAYVLAEKSVGAQIATIGDYFMLFFRPKSEDFRDVTVYELAPTSAEADDIPVLSTDASQRARLDVFARRVELPGTVIEQKTGLWFNADGTPLGDCAHLPRGADRAFAKRLADRR